MTQWLGFRGLTSDALDMGVVAEGKHIEVVAF